MSLRKKIAQMLVMGFSGCTIDDQSPVKIWLMNEGLGGVLLFDKDLATGQQGKNLRDQAQIKALTAQLKACSSSDLPLFVALDYEGGAVDRLKHIPGCRPTITPAQQACLAEKDFDKEIRQMAILLRDLGFNLDFAPVVDINLVEAAGIIGRLERSFSKDPRKVSALARRFIDVFHQESMYCAYKHFPGHGSASGDTHTDFVDVSDSWQASELEPYRHLQAQDAKKMMIMTAHVINRNLDASGLPASLSHRILTGILRKELGFEGVIISDDLQMQAIASHYSLKESLALTLNAGADMLIFGNQLGNVTATEVIDCIENLVLEEVIPVTRIDEAYARITVLKQG